MPDVGWAQSKCRYGLVFSDKALSLDQDANIVSIPLDYFFLI